MEPLVPDKPSLVVPTAAHKARGLNCPFDVYLGRWDKLQLFQCLGVIEYPFGWGCKELKGEGRCIVHGGSGCGVDGTFVSH